MVIYSYLSCFTEPLSSEEKSRIEAYADCGTSHHDISRILGRSQNVISNYLRNPHTYGTKKHTGRPRMLNSRDDRRIQRAASNSTRSLRKIKADLNLPVCRETVRTSLKRSGNIVRRKMRVGPRLTATHRRKRLAFALHHTAQLTNWHKVNYILCFSFDFSF